MATRIENSRPNKRPQAVVTYSTGGGTITVVSGKMMRLDQRGFPDKNGVVTTAIGYSEVA